MVSFPCERMIDMIGTVIGDVVGFVYEFDNNGRGIT